MRLKLVIRFLKLHSDHLCMNITHGQPKKWLFGWLNERYKVTVDAFLSTHLAFSAILWLRRAMISSCSCLTRSRSGLPHTTHIILTHEHTLQACNGQSQPGLSHTTHISDFKDTTNCYINTLFDGSYKCDTNTNQIIRSLAPQVTIVTKTSQLKFIQGISE